MKVINQRARAWILIQADSPQDAAKRIYEELVDKGGDDYVVIRADIVDYVYNIVIAVDAASGEWLERVHQIIREITGVRQTAILPVKQHVPSPPHYAQSFITDDEVAAGEARGIPEGIKPGRQHWSPGENPWG
jgi:predicted aspartyl protease